MDSKSYSVEQKQLLTTSLMWCTCHVFTFLTTVYRQSGCGAAEQQSWDCGCNEKNTSEWKNDQNPLFKPFIPLPSLLIRKWTHWLSSNWDDSVLMTSPIIFVMCVLDWRAVCRGTKFHFFHLDKFHSTEDSSVREQEPLKWTEDLNILF